MPCIKSNPRLFVLFAIACICVSIGSYLCATGQSENTSFTNSVNGTVAEIYDSTTVIVSYYVDSKQYYSYLGGSYKLNEKIIIYYDPSDPNIISATGYIPVNKLNFGFGVLILVIGIFSFIFLVFKCGLQIKNSRDISNYTHIPSQYDNLTYNSYLMGPTDKLPMYHEITMPAQSSTS